MPTATSLSGYSLSNIGPLTTTFSAPASCSTNYIGLGVASIPTEIVWMITCPFVPPADCNPTGSVIQSIFTIGEGGNPTAGNILVYHSPGLVCPAGWETVGAAAKPNPTSTSISGAFNLSTAFPAGGGGSFFVPAADVLIEVLEPGETAVLCCPRFVLYSLPLSHAGSSVCGAAANTASIAPTHPSTPFAIRHCRIRCTLRARVV